MKRLAALATLLPLACAAVAATPPPALKLWRLDCGTFVTRGFTDSCYLIRHGRDWMLWDAGLGAEMLHKPTVRNSGSVAVLDHTLPEQLAELGLKPDDVSILGLSHIHYDHVGQAAAFPTARLVLGEQDWARITAMPPAPGLEPYRLAPWISGGAPKQLVTGDHDVFGDGSVVMLALPGHTPGHHGLLVRLAKDGPLLLSGDLYDTERQYAAKEANPNEDDRQALLESFRRFDDLVRQFHAKVVIQHDPDDIAKLPPFPQPAS
ncbi:MAG TPA: N-acyl homoserine lactonase family protein [Caulobacteraceae bacterium]